MASKAGRKRKATHREPNGRPQRPTQAVLNQITKDEALKVKSVVLMQPHRNGSESDQCVTALGRFWLKLNTTNKVILHAGEHYAGLVRRWRSAHGLVSAHAPEEGTGTGDGPAWSTVRGWLEEINAIERVLLRASGGVLEATKQVAVDDRDPETRQQANDALLGLRLIAIEVNLLGPSHPFR